MKYIVYLSSSSIYFYPEKLEDMLIGFRHKNKANNITGMMLYSEGNFLQVLEGEDEVIDVLVKKIKKDKRHHSLVQIDAQEINERIFPAWSMGFKVPSAGDLNHIKGFADPNNPDSFPTSPQGHHPVVTLIKRFCRKYKDVNADIVSRGFAVLFAVLNLINLFYQWFKLVNTDVNSKNLSPKNINLNIF